MGTNADLISKLIFNQKSHKFQEIQKTVAVALSLDLRNTFFLALPLIGKLTGVLTEINSELNSLLILLGTPQIDVVNTPNVDKLVKIVQGVTDANIERLLPKVLTQVKKSQDFPPITPEAFNSKYQASITKLSSLLAQYNSALESLASLGDQTQYIPTSLVKSKIKDNIVEYMKGWKAEDPIQDLASAAVALKALWDRCVLDRSIDPLYSHQDTTFEWVASPTSIVSIMSGPFRVPNAFEVVVDGTTYSIPASSSWVKGTEKGPFTFVLGDTLKVEVGNQVVETALIGILTVDNIIPLINAPLVAVNDDGYLSLSSANAGDKVVVLPTAASVTLGLPVGVHGNNLAGYTDADDIAKILKCTVLHNTEYSGNLVIDNSVASLGFDSVHSGNLILRIPGKAGSWVIDIVTGATSVFTAADPIIDYSGNAQLFSEVLRMPAGTSISGGEPLGLSNDFDTGNVVILKDGTKDIFPSLVSIGDVICCHASPGAANKFEVYEVTDKLKVSPNFENGQQSVESLWCRSIYEWDQLVSKLTNIVHGLPMETPSTVGRRQETESLVKKLRLKVTETLLSLSSYDLGLQKKQGQDLLRSFKSLLGERGFDRALSVLLNGDLKTFFELNEVDARHLGKVRLLAESLRN